MRQTAAEPARRRAETIALAALLTGFVLLIDLDAVQATMGGSFVDPDDALRLVEVRQWLAGQSWFDLGVARLDPDHPVVMHWSRLVDLPPALLIKIFGAFLPLPSAERLAAVVCPAAYLFALAVAMQRLAGALFGDLARWPIVLGLAFSGTALVTFAPGRIGHHAPETLALVLATGSLALSFDPRRALPQGVAAGFLIALALAMSLETLPFLAVLVATLVALWIVDPGTYGRPLFFLSAGLAGSLVLFVALGTTQSWSDILAGRAPPCDQFETAHAVAGCLGGAALMLLIRWPRVGSRFSTRVIAVAGLAVALALLVRRINPHCLADPFATVDPLLVELWQSHVRESLPLPRFFAEQPMLALAAVVPVALGLLGGLAVLVVLRGKAAARLLLVLVPTAIGLALSFWQVRVLTTTAPLALCCALAPLIRLRGTLAARGAPRAASAVPFAILLFTASFWLIVLPPDRIAPDVARAQAAKRACLTPEALRPLSRVPAGTIVGPLDMGAHLLEATPHAVYAGPYHRDHDGISFDFAVFLGAPDEAHQLLTGRRVTYVLTCPQSNDLTRLAARAPEGLAAVLARGEVPPFLTPIPLGDSPYRLFRVGP